ncbi:MAG: hypothetical protein EOM23_10560, partial [Candidatus Moranbacteria bacterium]|nr:hypothetical protein [Candidatus Moranbacteria bacterium]
VLFAPVTTGTQHIFQLLGRYLLVYFILINFMLAMFNMLPIYPLDGFNFVNTFLPYGNSYQNFMRRYGFFLLLGVIIVGQIGEMIHMPYLNIFGQFFKLIYSLIEKTIIARLLG